MGGAVQLRVRRRAAAAAWLFSIAAIVAATEPGAQQVAKIAPPPPVEKPAPGEEAKAPGPAAVHRAVPRPSPPLSIHDAIQKLEAVAAELQNADPPVSAQRLAALHAHLGWIAGYIRAIDNAHSTLPYYKWHYIGSNKVKPGRTETDQFVPGRPIPHVSAVTFRTTRGDVHIERVTVHDKSGEAFEFTMNRTIPEGRPRREVCFLDREFDLIKVVVVYRQLSRQGQKNPRLKLDAGICSIAEYDKHAIYELTRARNTLEKRQGAQASERVRKAAKLLRAFRKSRRL